MAPILIGSPVGAAAYALNVPESSATRTNSVKIALFFMRGFPFP